MLQCSPCGKIFSGKENYDQHIVSDKHKKKVLLLKNQGISDNFTPKVSGDSTLGLAASKPECEACNILFDTFENFYRHSMTLEHALKVQLKISNNNFNANVSSTTKPDNYKVHGSSDTKHDDEIVIGFNSDSIGSRCSSYKSCAVCNKIFSGPEPYKQHINSENHKKKIQLQEHSLVGFTTNSYNHKLHNAENDKNPVDEVIPVFNNVCSRPQSLLYLSCSICKQNFIDEELYEIHIASENHKKEEALQKNLSSSGTNQTIAPYSCKTCKKIFSGEVPYKQHMDSETHKKKQLQHSHLMQHFQSYVSHFPAEQEKSEVNHANDFNPWFCQICKIQCSGFAPFQQHLKGSAHSKKAAAQGLNNELKSDIDRMLPIQESNFHANDVLEILDNIPKFTNDSIKKNNQKMEEDTLMPNIGNKLNVIDTDELEQTMKIFLPDQEIDFDKL